MDVSSRKDGWSLDNYNNLSIIPFRSIRGIDSQGQKAFGKCRFSLQNCLEKGGVFVGGNKTRQTMKLP